MNLDHDKMEALYIDGTLAKELSVWSALDKVSVLKQCGFNKEEAQVVSLAMSPFSCSVSSSFWEQRSPGHSEPLW